jgi:hypothetical protein
VLALDASGHIWSWGTDIYGELGLGLPANTLHREFTPAQIQLNNVRQIDATNVRAAALLADGTVYNWGSNGGGQLGLGNTAYVNTPTQVGTGTITDAVAVAMCTSATIAVRPSGDTYVWGDNYYGALGVVSPASAPVPILGPVFSPNVQVYGQYFQFASIERTGVVKTWGAQPLGYTPASPSPGGGSYVPTTPAGLCPAVPAASFPECGPQRAYYQRPSATYVAAKHGYTLSPAEVGTYGTTTVIDASQPPYNGTVTFDGVYHLRGDVQVVNGTFSLLRNTIFYVDGNSGQARAQPYYNATTLDVQNATLRLSGATLRANCPVPWGGVTLTGNGKIYTEAVFGGKSTTRSVIRDASIGVHSYTADYTVDNTNEYYLLQTNFINNDTGLFDLAKGTAKPGEGARECVFQDGRVGIQFESVDYFPTRVYGGDYRNAVFDANGFQSLQQGLLGQAGALRVTNSTFTNNYFASIEVLATAASGGSIHHNTVVVPAVWPAALLAQFPAGYAPVSTGINATGATEITANTVIGANRTPAANPVRQVGMALAGNCRIYDGNALSYLREGLAMATSDYGSGSTHYVVGNTFDNNVDGLIFSGSAYYYQGVPQVTLRCNTFRNALAGGAGVWVKAGTPFPASLGTASQPNGNRFDGMADRKKRFVYDVVQPSGAVPFTYHRYNSPQEEFDGPSSDQITNSAGTVVAVANNTQIVGTNACGGSSLPGVEARSIAAGPSSPQFGNTAATKVQLGDVYPNPASETVSFAYFIPAGSPPAVLVLRNAMGQRVAAQPLREASAGEARFSVLTLPAGLYTGTVEVAGQVRASHKVNVAR